jgi:hypothetical protein
MMGGSGGGSGKVCDCIGIAFIMYPLIVLACYDRHEIVCLL